MVSQRGSATGFELLAAERDWTGEFVTAGREHFRHADGEQVTREKVWHPGAVGILPVDDTHLWLTRQPREVAGLTASLEIPAGKRDVAGEAPLRTAQRELGEEIGKSARRWEELKIFYTSPGFSDERVWLYLASDLADDPAAESEVGERIEIVPWPLDQLEAAFQQCQDSKSLIALLWLAQAFAQGRLGRS